MARVSLSFGEDNEERVREDERARLGGGTSAESEHMVSSAKRRNASSFKSKVNEALGNSRGDIR